MVDLSIKACVREKVGTGAARAVRRNKMVPAVVYKSGSEPLHIAVSEKDALLICHRFDAKTNSVTFDLDGKKVMALPKKITLHPVDDSIEHVEFISFEKGGQLSVEVPIKVVGRDSSAEIKRGGVVNMAKRFLKCTVQCDNIPRFVTIDISNVKTGVPVSLRDIAVPSGVVAVHENLDQTILKITGKKSAAVATEQEEATPAAEEGSENKD